MKTTINKLYNACSFSISNLLIDKESKEYKGTSFLLNRKKIISRSAKITPKKNGLFVTFWKRNKEGITEPYKYDHPLDFYAITVENETRIGQFVFPKLILIEKGILSTPQKDGKRGFRVYPIWENDLNASAKKTQNWQLDYFVEFGEDESINSLKKLYIS